MFRFLLRIDGARGGAKRVGASTLPAFEAPRPVAETLKPSQAYVRPSLLEMAAYAGLVLLATLLVAALVVQNFDGVLLGPSHDENLFSYQSYFFGQNLSLLPLPHLNLVNNQTFYPYGADQVFQPWGLEREYFGACCRGLFGIGPWMQVYFLYSLVITAIGAYVLLRRDYPAWRAMAIGLAVSFANFYAIGKYPGHLNIACPHWVTLGVIADYLIFSHIALRQTVSARLLLVRGLLLALSFGLDLGYICGIGLTSLLLTLTVSGIVVAIRARGAVAGLKSQLREFGAALFASAREHRRQCATLAVAAATVAFLYIPILVQISQHAKQFGSLGDQGAWYSNPIRLLLPCLPVKINAIDWHLAFRDTPEAFFASSPGYMFLLPGALGLFLARRRMLVFVPTLVLLGLIMVYHPHNFPVLKPLPWFAFSRVQGRLTIIYPVLFALFSLGAPNEFFRLRRGRVLLCCALGLAATEVVWSYGGPMVRHFDDPIAEDGTFDPFMQTVRNSPGEAVLEWPFCISAGNGIGSPLNSYYDKIYTTFTLRQFHEKKTISQFFSRMHPSQCQVFLERGWGRVFAPDHPSIVLATHQSRDLTEQEWKLMEDFFLLNDFCGIILYTKFLPQETVDRFHERFGQPVTTTAFGRAGPMEFLRKPEHLRSLVNRERGLQVALGPAESPQDAAVELASGGATAQPAKAAALDAAAGSPNEVVTARVGAEQRK